MTSQQLFIALLHRLKKWGDACVLYELLRHGADEREVKTTTTAIAQATGVSRPQTFRALARLGQIGLIDVRAQQSFRTIVTANRDAIWNLLRQPVSDNAPGAREDVFPALFNLPPDLEGEAIA